jgi:hypothetical protein
MAAPTVQAILDGIQDRLKTIDGLQVSAYMPDTITPPHAIVEIPYKIDYHSTMARGEAEYDIRVRLFVSAAIDYAGQEDLADYASATGPKSVIAAIEGDRTLGDIVDDCVISKEGFRPISPADYAQVQHYAGDWDLRVLAKGI